MKASPSLEPGSADFRVIFEATPNPYLLLNADAPTFTIEAVNEAYLGACGQRRSELIGRGLFEAFPDNPDDPSATGVSDLRASLDRVLRDKASDTMGVQRYDIPTSDPSRPFDVRYWSPINTPIVEEDGSVRFIIHRVEDVTQFMLAREARVEGDGQGGGPAAPDRMEAEVREGAEQVKEANRQLKLVSVELAEANAKLQTLDRAKSEFFSNVSHEFRTPLTLLLGPINELLAESDETLSPVGRAALEMAQRNAARLLRLVNMLLDFSRIEAGRHAADLEPTDLPGFTAELASSFHSSCTDAGLTLTIDCPPLPEAAMVDQAMWEKVVLNLVSNAFKFTLKGGIDVSIRAHDDELELTVRDTGVGIAPAELERVFERFHRIEGQRGRTHEGSGIGLSLVQELVRAHDGMIRAESEVGRGSAFVVTLPYRKGGVVESSRGMPAGRLQAEIEPWFQGGHSVESGASAEAGVGPVVLLADDNADMRQYVGRSLRNAGYQVYEALDGEAALAAVQAGVAPDLVLTDVMMPGALDGFALLRALRAAPLTALVPVILLSARAGEEARVEGLDAGADDYVVKPFGVRELLARVDGALRLAELRREAASRDQELRAAQTAARLRLAADAAQLGEVVVDLATGELNHTSGFARLLGWPDSARLTLDDVRQGYHPDDCEDALALRSALVGPHAYFEVEHRVIRRDGEVRWIAGRGEVSRDAVGTARELTAVFMDVTDRKLAERRRNMLIDELNHRVKNTLATVQSIAVLTRANAESPATFGADFEARITALAGAHDLLTRASWEGASMADVLGVTLAPLRASSPSGAARVTVAGDPVRLGPNAAITLNMAFHELATNALKYGALSNDRGRVNIGWSIDHAASPPAVELAWIERDGPPVAPPTRRGFGSRLLQQGLARELDGRVNLEFKPEGLHCTLRLPLTRKVSME